MTVGIREDHHAPSPGASGAGAQSAYGTVGNSSDSLAQDKIDADLARVAHVLLYIIFIIGT
jgi:hypothetical protein